MRGDHVNPPRKTGLLEVLKDAAPVITGIGTLLLSFASFYWVHTQDREKAELAILDVRQKALAGAVETEKKKRDIAASTLALYGPDLALPAIRVLLNGSYETSEIREFGVRVVSRWMDSGNKEARSRLLSDLLGYARSDVVSLRRGSYEALAAIVDGLSQSERDPLLQLLVERFGTGDQPVEADQDATRKACPLLNYYDFSQSRIALRNIAKTPAASAAIGSYEYKVKGNLGHDGCKTLLKDLQGIQVEESLKDRRTALVVKVTECTQ